jgi:hypothetical protein
MLMGRCAAESLAREIFSNPSLKNEHGRPCVVQIRLGGSKGLLALMSPAQHIQYPGKKVILRDSMIKSLPHYDFADDVSLRTLDVLRCGYLRLGTTLSSEAIICMVANGVKPGVFVQMSDEALEELHLAFTPKAMEVDGKMETEMEVLQRIVRSCYTLGGAGAERKKRRLMSEGKSLRAAGMEKDFGEQGEIEDESPVGVIDPSERFGVDPVSGQSGSIAEA